MSINTVDLHPIGRRTDPHTSQESAEASEDTHKNVAEHVLSLAAERGRHGLTINEATDALSQFKAVSVSPVFKPLFNKGKLVRRVIGKTARGRDKYESRIDPETNCPGIIHYHFRVELESTPDIEAIFAVRKPVGTTGAEKASSLSAERRLRERRRGERRNGLSKAR